MWGDEDIEGGLRKILGTQRWGGGGGGGSEKFVGLGEGGSENFVYFKTNT